MATTPKFTGVKLVGGAGITPFAGILWGSSQTVECSVTQGEGTPFPDFLALVLQGCGLQG